VLFNTHAEQGFYESRKSRFAKICDCVGLTSFLHNKTLEGTDLVVWVKAKGDKKTSFKIQAPSAQDDDQD